MSGSWSPKKCLCFLWSKAHSVRKEHFLCVKTDGLYQDLILDINALGYRRDYHFFNIEGPVSFNPEKHYSRYTIEARFDQHDISGNSIFERMDKRSQRDYIRRAKRRKQKILQGWNEIDRIVVNYIRKTISQDYQSLPFI